MSAAARIGLGVATGYLLGRTKKLRLAVTLGTMIAGQRMSKNPVGLLRQASELVDRNPQLAELQQRVTGELFDAARSAALASATSRLESVNRSLQTRGERDDEESYDDEDDYDSDEYEDEDEDDYDGEDASEEDEDQLDQDDEDQDDQDDEDREARSGSR